MPDQTLQSNPTASVSRIIINTLKLWVIHMLQDVSGIENTGRNSLEILVIEDDHDDFYLLERCLSSKSCTDYLLTHADSLSDALRILSKTTVFDMIISDLNLPDSRGLDTVNAIVRHAGEIPIMVLTGLDNDEIGSQAIKAGAEDYIAKEHLNSALLTRSIRFAMERHQLLLRIKHQAELDSLTQLLNRSALYNKLNILIEQANRNQMNVALILFDLDDFKNINDSFGHVAGDDLLRQVSDRIKKDLRSSDLACRFGGDEFILVITNYADPEKLARKKLAQLSGDYNIAIKGNVTKIRMSISMGMAEWRRNTSIGDLITAADEAMYNSKRHGKNKLTASRVSVGAEQKIM